MLMLKIGRLLTIFGMVVWAFMPLTNLRSMNNEITADWTSIVFTFAFDALYIAALMLGILQTAGKKALKYQTMAMLTAPFGLTGFAYMSNGLGIVFMWLVLTVGIALGVIATYLDQDKRLVNT